MASGKSVITNEALKRFSAHRISTRQLIIDAGTGDDRSRLIEEGKRLDRETGGSWVAEQSRKYIEQHEACDVIIIDAVRTKEQVDHLRAAYGGRVWQQQGPLPPFVREMTVRIGMETYVRRQRVIGERQDSRDLLRAAKQPVRAICGREDGMSTIEEHIEIAELAPRGRFSIIEQCGHMTILERPQAATALLRDWLLYDT